MFSVLKKIIISFIGYSRYRLILTSCMRLLHGIRKKISYSEEVIEFTEYSVKNKNCFFGYYDLSSLSIDGDKLLSLIVGDYDDIAQVGYFDTNTKIFHKVSETKAWNWQMGARLRWWKDGESILFNDFDGKDFISRIVNINGKEEKRFAFPIFDVDMSHDVAYFTDFTILHHLKDGYGYQNKKIKFEDYYCNAENGVFKANLSTGKIDNLISIEELRKTLSPDDAMYKYHYINHITINPENGDVMFFHLWTEDGKAWRNQMVFMNADGCMISTICDFDRASHYDWLDDTHLLATVIIKGKTEYRLYDYRKCSYEKIKGVCTDGHPTFLSERFFITDTYASHYGMQSVYICDRKLFTYKNLFSIYHTPSKVGKYRCDLHPRISGNCINIDAVVNGVRSQFIIKIKDCSRESSRWGRRILLDNMASDLCQMPRHKNLFSYIRNEYTFMTGKSHGNVLKMLYLFWISPTFRVNVYINWMQCIRSSFKRRLIHNYLHVKYSAIVDYRSRIGVHLRADHPIGIVIGSHTVIGDFCKIYQNVTIGQKKGKFPQIGNNVTIYSGAVIIGDIKIGDNAVIGANAVVLTDIPANSTAVGCPARIINNSGK